jgi:hypothetical protein
MKSIKYLLLIIVIFFSNNLIAQEEDFFSFMGSSKADILKVYSEDKRIINGEYYELGFSISNNTNIHFYFNKDLLCNKVIIQKELKEYENAKLILSGDFPNKSQDDTFNYYWNKRMMVTLAKLKSSFVVAYEKVNLEFLKK